MWCDAVERTPGANAKNFESEWAMSKARLGDPITLFSEFVFESLDS